MNKLMGVVLLIAALGVGLIIGVWQRADLSPRSTNVVNPGDPLPSPPAEKTELIIDDASPGSLVMIPPEGWKPSLNGDTSHGGTAQFAKCDGTVKIAVFYADIWDDTEYEVFAWWNQTIAQYRCKNVPIIIHARSGDIFSVIDQTTGQIQWNSLGRHRFKKGVHQPIVTFSTNGLPVSEEACVIADAIKLVKE